MPSRTFEPTPDQNQDHDQDDVVDARYAHLIEPIRDLASNWNIDLASELEEYLADLDRITVSFDNGHTTLNFAQAALLIQGSACVYSKKVEYLYNLLYQTMDVVIQKRKRQASSVAADGTDLDALTSWSSDEACLMSLDDHIQPSKNIDLDENDLIDYERERRTSLMIRTPVGMNMNGIRENKKEEMNFRISQCQVHTSGALLLEERDSLLMDASLKRVAASPLDALPFGTPRALLSAQKRPSAAHSSPSLNHVEAPNFESAAHDDDSDDDNHHVDMDMGMDMPISDMNDGMDMKHVDDTTTVHETRGRKKQVTFATELVEYDRQDEEEEDKQAQDPWRTMDPHDAGSTRPRPFRKGRTYREPVSLQKSIAPSHVNDVLHLQPIQQLLLGSISSSSLKVPYFAEFAGVFLTHAQQRKQQYKLVQKQQQKAIRTRQQEAKLGAGIPLSPFDLSLDSTLSTDEADAWAAAACAPPDDDDDDDNNAPLDIAGDIQHDVDVDTNQWDSSPVDASAIPFEAVALDEELASLTKTYQDLCRQHVDSYLSSAAAYLSQTQLSKRVLEWQDRLEPILEEESHHPSYDIHEYGEKLVHSIQEAPETVKKAPDVLEFEQAVVGQPRYEICRLFLAALQLANQGNVEILPSQLSNVRDSNVDPALNGSMALHLLRSSRAQPHMHVQTVALSQLSQEQSQAQSQLQPNDTETSTSTSNGHAPAKQPSRTRATAPVRASKQKQRVLLDEDLDEDVEFSQDSPSNDTNKNKKDKAADKENVMLRANGRRRQRV